MNIWLRLAKHLLLADNPYLVLDDDCPPGNIYVGPHGRVVCHPRDARLGAKALRDYNEPQEVR